MEVTIMNLWVKTEKRSRLLLQKHLRFLSLSYARNSEKKWTKMRMHPNEATIKPKCTVDAVPQCCSFSFLITCILMVSKPIWLSYHLNAQGINQVTYKDEFANIFFLSIKPHVLQVATNSIPKLSRHQMSLTSLQSS